MSKTNIHYYDSNENPIDLPMKSKSLDSASGKIDKISLILKVVI